jgi:DNA-binding beta-propeller fold protein YncE
LPAPFTAKRNVPATQDLTFDPDGFLLVLEDGRSISRLTSISPPVTLVQNALGTRTASSILAIRAGDLLVADFDEDLLVRVDMTGTRRRVAEMLGPGKMVFGPGGDVFVPTFGGEVMRINVATGRSAVFARVEGRLRGVAFSPDFGTLYVSNSSGFPGSIHSIKLRADGTAEPAQLLARGMGDGPGGLAVDICGNVYVADYTGGPVRRVTPAGRVEVVAVLNAPASAVAFGSGKHGWDERTLYTASSDREGSFEIRLGVRGAPAPSF